MTRKLKSAGRTLTYILRHDPGNIKMAKDGYVLIEDILSKIKISYNDLNEIVINDNKNRFGIKEDKYIRANQGHSIDIDLGLNEITPPDNLYHGTVIDVLDLIKKTGLKKMQRHAVHLSRDLETATQVASRRKSENIILRVDTEKMFNDGFKFYLTDNNVWLTDNVPPKYISFDR